VLCTAEAAALWAGWRTDQHQATGQVEGLDSEATYINTVPFADQERPLRHVPGLKRLLVDRCAQLRDSGGQAATAGSLLATADGANDAHSAIGSVNPNLDCSLEELIVKSLLDGEWLKGEGTPRRFGEQW
jgi:hypothetical protein